MQLTSVGGEVSENPKVLGLADQVSSTAFETFIMGAILVNTLFLVLS